MTALGIATAWNPAAIGASFAVDAMIDLPIWYGGAQLFGWAFRLGARSLERHPTEELSGSDMVER